MEPSTPDRLHPHTASAQVPPRAHAPAAAGSEPLLQAEPDLLVCDECEAVHHRLTLAPGEVAHCVRCGAMLGRRHVVTPAGLVAFAIAALVFLVIANLAPIATLDLSGIRTSFTLPEAVSHTWNSGQELAAMLTALTAIVFPLALTLLRLYVLLPVVLYRVPRHFVPAMHALAFVTRWSMVEVLMLGALVAVVRSASTADLTPGIGLFAYAAVTLLLTSISAAGLHMLWNLPKRLTGASA
jgi:paraquat-inducible protein A